MAQKLTKKEKIALQKQSPSISKKEAEKKEKSKYRLRTILGLIVAGLAFLLYVNTLNHDYVLDDNGLIPDNTSTKKGISAIPEIFSTSYRYGMNTADYNLYRPLSKAMFAIEWSMVPDSPALNHFVNILMYALVCFMVFRTLNRYMNEALLVPFMTALIFAAHPIHTEIGANIKSRDEIMCLLFCLTAAFFFHSYVTKNSGKAFIAGIVSYFIALFSKESAVTFMAVIPLMYYFFTNGKKVKYITTISAMAVFTVIFLLIRKKVLGNAETLIPIEDNSLVAIKDFFVQKATAISILGVYLKLHVFPYPLIADGSYNHFPAVELTSWKFHVPFVILIGGAVYAILRFKRKDIISFCILYFFCTASLISNIFILIGTNYGERLMFVPSLGICLLFAVLINRLFKTETAENTIITIQSFFQSNKGVLLLIPLILVFGGVTIARNTAWKDDYTLYSTDIEKVPDSAHLLFYLANNITSDERLKALPDSAARMEARKKGIEYLNKSLEIFPKYADGWQRRGYIYYQMKMATEAERDYREALKYNPTHPIVYNNYGTLCFDQNRYEEAKFNFQQAVRYSPNYAHALNNLGSSFGVYGMGEAEMIQRDPANRDLHARQAQENFASSIEYFKRAIQADKEFLEPYRLIAVSYRNIGNTQEAERYERLYQELKQQSNVKN